MTIPAMSTTGFGHGTTEDGKPVSFVGDHRPMREIIYALQQGIPVTVEVEDWQVIPRGGKHAT